VSSLAGAEDTGQAIGQVGDWRREVAPGPGGSQMLVSRRAARKYEPVRSALLLRHPALSRVTEIDRSDAATAVVEEVGEARPLADGRSRRPRGDDLARQLLRLLEGLCYLHGHGLAHGFVSAETVFSDDRSLLLTGAALNAGISGAPADDVRAWAELTEDLLADARDSDLVEVVREAASQVLTAAGAGRAPRARRVIRAISSAMEDPVEAMSPSEEETVEEVERSRAMRVLLAVIHFFGSLIVGAFTTVLTIALIGAVVATGVLWFLDQLPQEIALPNVEGMSRSEATEVLEDEGLKVGRVRSVYREEVEPDHVAETVPPPGMTVREGREVTLVVSMGAARVKVPRLTGLRLDEAEEVLDEKGLRLVDGGEVRSDNPEGEIVRQDPPPGRKIAQGQRVVAHTSGGPDFGIVQVPAEDEDEDPRVAVFRRIVIVVPRGDALQRVEVREGYGEGLETTYDRLHRPGDRIKLDTHGRPGKRVKILIDGDEVLSTKLQS
jgi:hypothetical protein